MIRRRWIVATPALLLPRPGSAQPWPSRPIRMLCPFPPGGVSDLMARLVAGSMERRLGATVVVENRPGAGGNLAVDAVAKAVPDGHVIGVGTPSNLAINPHLFATMPYDVPRDLAPLSLFAVNPNVIVANLDVRARTVPDLVEWLRANPGTAFGSPGVGTTQHLAGQLLMTAAGVELQHVPYRGANAAALDLLAGRIPLQVDVIVTSLPLIREGKVRAIAVTTPERLPLASDIPTVAETFSGFEATSWLGFVAPAGVAPAILDRLAEAIAAAARDTEVARRVTEGGAVPRGTTRAEFAAFIRAEGARWAPAVRASGARVE